MVHPQRLISSKMIVTSCAITLLNICAICIASQEDISHNLIRDPVELGNPYPYHVINRDSSSSAGGGSGTGTSAPAHFKRKHTNHHHRRLSPHSSSHDVPQVPSLTHSESSSSTERITVRKGGSGVRRRGGSKLSSSHIRKNKEHHHQQHRSDEDDADEDCPMCAAARKNAGLDDETLRAVRVEIVKHQILKKLRLKEPPKMENVPKGHNTVLPPIALGNPVLHNNVRDDDVSNLDLEDFYGKPEQTIVLPEDELSDCSSWSISRPHQEAASCFIFKLPKEVRSNQISSAELWVYKLSDPKVHDELGENRPENHHNFSVSEMLSVSNYRVGSSSKRRGSPHFNTIVDRSDIPESAGWINFNITERARKWLVTDMQEHTIKISCSTCSLDVNEFPFDSTGEQQPFIVFNIASGKKRRRNRRSLNCSPGVTECCRESLYISFEEIKWDWVLEPRGFDAYYCKGNCHGDAALAHTATRHSGIMIDYVKHQGGMSNKTAELVPCCTATEMSPLSLIYRDPQSYNTTFQHVKLPNMVVQSCGCK